MNTFYGNISVDNMHLFENGGIESPKFIIGNIYIPTGYSAIEPTNKFFGSIIAVFGSVNLWDTDIDILDFKKLKYIKGYLNIQFTLFENLEMFKNLKYIGGNFDIRYCEELKTLKGLENLIYVGGDLLVKTCYDEEIEGFNTHLDDISHLNDTVFKGSVIGYSDGVKSSKK